MNDWTKKQIAQRPEEAPIIERLFEALEDAGDPLTYGFDGEETGNARTLESTLDFVFSVDEAWLYTNSGSFIYLTMGEGWDILCDHSLDLEDALEPLFDWIYEEESK